MKNCLKAVKSGTITRLKQLSKTLLQNVISTLKEKK